MEKPTMTPPAESLLKYDNPVRVSRSSGRKSPKPKSATTEASKQENEEILNCLLPPREWMEGNQLWVQQVSGAPCTRADVIHLEELLDIKLKERRARETGICPVRRELYSQCFDELIRQVTINCAERGLLLLRVRDELQMSIAVYQALNESSVAFGMRKALQAEQGKIDMEKSEEQDRKKRNQDLKKQLIEERLKYETIGKRENERRQIEEKKYTKEIQFLKRSNQQFKNQLEGILSAKK